jgi:hypothetical protein
MIAELSYIIPYPCPLAHPISTLKSLGPGPFFYGFRPCLPIF